MSASAEQLLGKHTRALQALSKAVKGRDKMHRKLDEAEDEEAVALALTRLDEAHDRVFDAETELDKLRLERMDFIETLSVKRKEAEQTLAQAHSSVKIAQSAVERFEADINRLRYP